MVDGRCVDASSLLVLLYKILQLVPCLGGSGPPTAELHWCIPLKSHEEWIYNCSSYCNHYHTVAVCLWVSKARHPHWIIYILLVWGTFLGAQNSIYYYLHTLWACNTADHSTFSYITAVCCECELFHFWLTVGYVLLLSAVDNHLLQAIEPA